MRPVGLHKTKGRAIFEEGRTSQDSHGQGIALVAVRFGLLRQATPCRSQQRQVDGWRCVLPFQCHRRQRKKSWRTHALLPQQGSTADPLQRRAGKDMHVSGHLAQLAEPLSEVCPFPDEGCSRLSDDRLVQCTPRVVQPAGCYQRAQQTQPPLRVHSQPPANGMSGWSSTLPAGPTRHASHGPALPSGSGPAADDGRSASTRLARSCEAPAPVRRSAESYAGDEGHEPGEETAHCCQGDENGLPTEKRPEWNARTCRRRISILSFCQRCWRM